MDAAAKPNASSVPTSATGSAGVMGTRRTTAIVIAVVSVLIIVAVYISDTMRSSVTEVELIGGVSGSAPRAGEQAPDFRVTLLDGTSTSLGDLQGQPLWLTFGASWCSDCRVEAPDLEATYERFAPDGLAMLQISVSEDASAARAYAERAGLTFPTAADPADAISGRYHILGIPTHFFIEPDGTIADVRLGGLQPDDMVQAVEALLE